MQSVRSQRHLDMLEIPLLMIFGAALKSGDISMTEFNDKLIELDSDVGGFADKAKTATGRHWYGMDKSENRSCEGNRRYSTSH